MSSPTLSFDEDWLREYCKRTGKDNPLEDRATGASGAKAQKPRKYRNEPTVVDGIRFDSKREASRYGELKLMLLAGEIAGITRQQPFLLPGGVRYVADFVVLLKDGRYRVEDAKGVRTREYINKRKQMVACLGIEIVEV